MLIMVGGGGYIVIGCHRRTSDIFYGNECLTRSLIDNGYQKDGFPKIIHDLSYTFNAYMVKFQFTHWAENVWKMSKTQFSL